MTPRLAVAVLTALGLALGASPAWAHASTVQGSTAVTAAPVAVDDTATLVAESTSVVDVLANDTYAVPAELSVPSAGLPGSPAHGVATVVPVTVGGVTRPAVSYAPESGWYGSDSFRYAVTDASGIAASAAVTLTVTPAPPTAGADTASVAPADVVRIAVLDNDTDPYAGRLTVTSVAAGAHGTTAVVDSGTAITYAPGVGWSGADTLTYTVTSTSGATATGRVTVTTLPSSPGHAATLSAPTSLLVLRTLTLTGAVNPYAAALPSVAVQSLTPAGWTTYARLKPDARGSFSMRWTAHRPGRVQWRALAIWPDGTSATSPTATTTLVASADPAVSGPLTRRQVPYSYRPGCPVGPASLRRLSINYWDYTGLVRRGDVILAASAVPAVRTVFTQAFSARFRVKQIVPTDAFYGRGRLSPTQSDINAMNAGNTSAFNCRSVTGSRYRMSQHSYGNAIDVNTYQNPYATSSRIYPAAAAYRYYVTRSRHLGDVGVINPWSAMAKAFAARRWLWGARWAHHDYQHFSSNGG
jgi:hypothetical protein